MYEVDQRWQTNYKPGDGAKLGLDAATLLGINPDLIYAEITGYGLQDPVGVRMRVILPPISALCPVRCVLGAVRCVSNVML